jgi:hypothetical protein
MMNHRSVRTPLCFATAIFSLMLSPWLLGGNSSPRPIASLSGEKRMKLPGETLVKLHSGRIATLAVLRREHELRMQRFKNAPELGRAIAAKMKMKRPVATASTSAKPPYPAAKTYPTVTMPTAPAPRKIDPNVLLQAMQITMVSRYPPLEPPWVAIDMAQACPVPTTLCLYVPQGTLRIKNMGGGLFAIDDDPLIVDNSICVKNGGAFSEGECHFYYFMSDFQEFAVTGKLSMTGTCDSPFQAVLDPRGAAKTWYNSPLSDGQTVTFQNPVMCAVQVWMTK